MQKLLRDNSLTIVLMTFFALSLVGMIFSGEAVSNKDRLEHGLAALSLSQYLVSGEFMSALYENWESEFLQMAVFVTLTAYLYQRGSPESRDPDATGPETQDRDPRLDKGKKNAPLAVRVGGTMTWIYGHSLGLVLFILYLISFALHWVNSARAQAATAAEHGEKGAGLVAYLGDAQLWFESFQNWQSEFLSTAVLIVLAIFLREKGSPESKPVGAPHSQTGV